MTELQGRFEVAERRACAVVDQPRSTQRYEAKKKTDEPALCRRLREIVRQRPRFGYRRLTAVLKRDGWSVNAKRVHRLCRKEALGCFSLRGQRILLFLDGVVAFELGRGDVPQRGMAALGVVVSDVRRQFPRRLGAIGVLDQFQLGLRPEEKTRGRSTTP